MISSNEVNEETLWTRLAQEAALDKAIEYTKANAAIFEKEPGRAFVLLVQKFKREGLIAFSQLLGKAPEEIARMGAQLSIQTGLRDILCVCLDVNPGLLQNTYEQGKTLLHIAVDNNQEKLIKLLLRLGANPDQTDTAGKTPLQLAQDKQMPTLVRIIQYHQQTQGMQEKMKQLEAKLVSLEAAKNNPVMPSLPTLTSIAPSETPAVSANQASISKRLDEAEETIKKQQEVIQQQKEFFERQSTQLRVLKDVNCLSLKVHPLVLQGKNHLLESEGKLEIVGISAGKIIVINEREEVELWDGKTRKRLKTYGPLVSLLQAQTDLVKALMKTLQDKNMHVCSGAAEVLAELRVITPDVVQVLVRNSTQGWHTESSSKALVKIGTTPEVVRCLLQVFKDENIDIVFSRLAEIIAELKVDTPEIVQNLFVMLKMGNDSNRYNAAKALGKLKVNTPEVVQALLQMLKEDKGISDASTAGCALVEIGGTPEVVQGLLQALHCARPTTSWAAIRALGEIKLNTPEVVQGLLQALNSGLLLGPAADALDKLNVSINTPEIVQQLLRELMDGCWPAVEVLKKLKVNINTPDVVQTLLRTLKDGQSFVRNGAVSVLGEIEAKTPEVVQGLLQALNDRDKDVRNNAARVLGKLKANTPEVAQSLLLLVKDKEYEVRISAAEALVKLRIDVPAEIVQDLLQESKVNKDVRINVAKVLRILKINTPEVVQALLQMLKDSSMGFCDEVVEALVMIGGTPEVIQGLFQVLKENNYYFGFDNPAARALVKIGSTPEIVQGLFQAIKDENEKVRESAVWALGELKVNTPEIVLTILQESVNYNRGGFGGGGFRESFAKALVKIGCTPEIVQGLLEVLKGKDVISRRNAVKILGELKHSAPEVIEGLLHALKDEDQWVCKWAAAALAKMKVIKPEVVQTLLPELNDFWAINAIKNLCSVLTEWREDVGEDYLLLEEILLQRNQSNYLPERVALRNP